jgi:hypothetical protein
MGAQRGQALVESALTLPLVIFMALGAIQLFMMMQGRAMAQYAVARATRAGSLKSGSCTPMLHTAVGALLPTFTVTTTPAQLADAFDARRDGRFNPAKDQGRTEPIVWLERKSPTPGTLRGKDEEELFDLGSNDPQTLNVRMVFWYPLRIPFADWVWSRLMLGYFGLRTTSAVNPLAPTQTTASWNEGQNIDGAVGGELVRRADRGHYSAPIQVSYTMKMMSPARSKNFAAPFCQPYP